MPRKILDMAAILTVLLGGLILPILGSLLGIILLWSSPNWTARQKLAGTLLPPGGFSLMLVVIGLGATGHPCSSTCTGGQTSLAAEILFVIAVGLAMVLPVITAIYLISHRAQNHGTASPTSGVTAV